MNSAIANVISGLSGTGNVHEYTRWSADWDKFLDLFKTDAGIISGWMISRQSVNMHRTAYGEVQKAHVFSITAIYGLSDEHETELEFQEILDTVQEAFQADPTLSGACETINPEVGPMSGQYGLQIELIENRIFGSVLCHTAECRLCCIELI